MTVGNGADASFDAERVFARVADDAPVAMWLSDAHGAMAYVTRAWVEITGQDAATGLGDGWRDALHPDDLARITATYEAAVRWQRSFDYDYRLRMRDGSYRWINDRGRPRFDDAGTYLGHIGVIVDVHGRVERAEALREREARLQRMTEFRRGTFELFEEGLATRDPASFYRRVVTRAVDVIQGAQAGAILLRADDDHFSFVAAEGYDLEALRDVRFEQDEVGFGVPEGDPRPIVVPGPLAPPGHVAEARRSSVVEAGRMDEIRAVLVVPVVVDGTTRAVLTLDAFDRDDAFGDEAIEMGRVFGAQAATLLHRFELERDLRDLAYHDDLTALPNRAAFVASLDAALRDRTGDDEVAVLFVDLDDLKPINDSLGHRAGDDVLHEAARRLRDVVGDAGTVARLGGDEFTVLLQGAAIAQADAIAARLRDALEATVPSRGYRLHVGASIGISRAPKDGTSAEDLLRRADIAMYAAKDRGKGEVVAFERSMEVAPLQRLANEEALWRALDRGELRVHYQPRRAVPGGGIVAMEALLRWQHPDQGLLLPEAFFDAAEGSSLLHALERFVLGEAVEQVRAWRDAGAADLRVSVNVTTRQLAHRRFLEAIREALAASGVPATALELKVQHVTRPQREADVAQHLHTLRGEGVGLALSGFGNSGMPLPRIAELPFDTVVVDPSFVRRVDEDDATHDVVRALVDLGRAFGRRVVLQGVETDAAWRRLAPLAATQAQGFALGRPAPAEEAAALLAESHAHAR